MSSRDHWRLPSPPIYGALCHCLQALYRCHSAHVVLVTFLSDAGQSPASGGICCCCRCCCCIDCRYQTVLVADWQLQQPAVACCTAGSNMCLLPFRSPPLPPAATMLTVDQRGEVALWPAAACERSGFGWFVPKRRYQLPRGLRTHHPRCAAQWCLPRALHPAPPKHAAALWELIQPRSFIGAHPAACRTRRTHHARWCVPPLPPPPPASSPARAAAPCPPAGAPGTRCGPHPQLRSSWSAPRSSRTACSGGLPASAASCPACSGGSRESSPCGEPTPLLPATLAAHAESLAGAGATASRRWPAVAALLLSCAGRSNSSTHSTPTLPLPGAPARPQYEPDAEDQEDAAAFRADPQGSFLLASRVPWLVSHGIVIPIHGPHGQQEHMPSPPPPPPPFPAPAPPRQLRMPPPLILCT